MTAPLATVIGLGRLVELVLRTGSSQRLRAVPAADSWLAWKPDTRDLVVLHPNVEGANGVPSRADARRHHAFHGQDPALARAMEWPDRHGAVRTLGLIESLTYTADRIHSPSKRAFCWIHRFGDRGERGHGRTQPDEVSPYPDRLLPRLNVDSTGHLAIVRRPGNRYVVRDWIIG